MRLVALLAGSVRRLLLVLLLLGVAAAGALALLQTPVGRDAFSRIVARTASGPGFEIEIRGLRGTVPFDVRAERIEIADASGVWLALDGARLDVAVGRLFLGRLHIRELTAVNLDVHRLPELPDGPDPAPWSERLRMPSLPIPATLDRFAIDRIALAPEVLGETVEAAVTGKAASHDGATEIALDLRRSDGVPGHLDLQLRQGGADANLQLRLVASEPSGVLLGRLLGRSDRPPLLVSLSGDGPLADWRGRLEASAGQLARVAADVAIAAGRETMLSLTGTAAVSPLLPPGMAALTGDAMPITARATLREEGAIALDELAIELAAGRLAAAADFAGPDRAIAGHVSVSLSDIAAASALAGEPLRGSAQLAAAISGTEDRPRLRIEATGESIGFAGSGADRAAAQAEIAWDAKPADPAARLSVAASGQLRGVALPDGVPHDLGRDLDWSLSGSAAPDARAVELREFTVQGVGIDVAGAGRIEEYGRVLDGRMRILVAELGAFAGLVGHPIGGSLTLDVSARQQSPDRIVATLDGSAAKLDTGIAALDALAGRSIAIAGSAERDAAGVLRLDRLTLTGAGLSLDAAGRFDPGTAQLAATVAADIRDLRPAGAALGTPIAGQVGAELRIEGPLGHSRVQVRLDGSDLKAGTAVLDRVRLDAELADAAQRRVAIDGKFRSFGMDGTLSLVADAGNPDELAIRQMKVKAAGGVLDADLRVESSTLLARGKIAGRVPDLAPWSQLAGNALAGAVEFTAEFEKRAGQGVDLTVTGDRLSSGGGGSRVAVGHIAVSARLGDVLGTPFGNARASLTGASFGAGGLSSATLSLDGPRPGRFAFRAEAWGRAAEPLAFAADGTGEIAPGGAVDLRFARLAGTLGPDRFQLTRPLTLSRRGDDVALSGLALALGGGRITGDAARRGSALSLRLSAENLPVATAGRLAGYPDASGRVALEATVDGTVAAPRGRFSASGRSLGLATARDQLLPSLALDLTGAWNGRDLDLTGRISAVKGDALAVSGTVPLVLDQRSFGVALPPQGRLALRLSGSGDVANLADMLPLGEDRVGGRFALDAAVNGTVAAPAASGRLTIADGRYESFASGAVLNDLRLVVVGDRDRLTVQEFSARDSGSGSLAAQGAVLLGGLVPGGGAAGGAGPSANLSLTLKDFRILGRDVAVVAASGTVAVTGPIAAPNVAARLATDQGELRIPASLPPSVTRLQVVEVNSRTGKRPAPAQAQAGASPPALPVSLDIGIAVPGRIFVRGRGLDSEWRGRLGVTGTSAKPQVSGSLEAIRGTFDFLGKTFQVTRGRIGFGGGATIDPVLDIVAEVAAAEITAQVLVAGPVSSPTVTMTSTPVVPQDEILSRVLFGRGVGQITAAEGIQVAQAAAALAGGGFDVLDRLRGRLGLDRLVFGSAPSGLASSNLNPAAGGSAASGTAISGGKYVAEGVYVGASQGLTPHSSKIIVEIELRPRVTVQGDVSQGGGSGIGLNYKYDY